MQTEIIITLVLLLAVIVVYLYTQNNLVEVTKYEVSDTKISKEFNNYKIIQLSDIHNIKSKVVFNDILRVLDKEKPDIVVITGDLIHNDKTKIEDIINKVKRISYLYKVYYVSGNHEALYKNYEKLTLELKRIGVVVLNNKLELLKINESSINLIGVKDPRFYKANNKLIMKKNIEDIKYSKKNYTILLSHRPELFDIYEKEKIDLVFVGHAHGGQFRLPFVGSIYSPNQGLFPKYASGIHKKNSTAMIVNRGIGNSDFPFRINNRPEIVSVKFKVK